MNNKFVSLDNLEHKVKSKRQLYNALIIDRKCYYLLQ